MNQDSPQTAPGAARADAAKMLPGWDDHLRSLSPDTRAEVFRVLGSVSSFLSDRHPVVMRELSLGLRASARGKLSVRERDLLTAYFSAVQAPLLALVTLAEPV